jgi:hypothetical protein
MNPTIPQAVNGSDSITCAIVDCLEQLETKGMGALVRTEANGAVRLTFGRYRSFADTFEVALMRLVGEMLEDLKYSPMLIIALREHMPRAA